MSSFALAALAGASCLLATYNVTRGGSVLVAVAIVATIGVATGWIVASLSKRQRTISIWLHSLTFALGASVSEAIAFAHYYFSYGYKDLKLSVAIGVSIIEAVVISVVGSVVMALAMWLTTHHVETNN